MNKEISTSASYPESAQDRFDIDREQLPELPVDRYRDESVATINQKQITIVSAETGAGKSTRFPRYLLDTGLYNKIYMTQPRILAARNVSERLRQGIVQDEVGDATTVGYATAHEGDATDDSRIVVMTDGLLIMKLLEEGEVTKDDVIVIDEFHERNKYMDAVLALCIRKGIKTVVMSATLEIDRLVKHCQKAVGEDNVALIEIPGKVYEIEEHTAKEDRDKNMSETIYQAAKRGENVLAFVPGRREAQKLEGILAERFGMGGPTILQLNGDQTPEEQQKCIDSYKGGKVIISTSVGQTSITIPDIDTVVDCGWERTGTYEKGIHSVPVQPCSKATMDQRRGRVGRTKPGQYFQARLDGGPEFPDADDDTASYDVPEILRTDMLELVLRLARAGIDLAELDGLLDRPESDETQRVRSRAINIGAVAINAANEMTTTPEGNEMTRYPIDAQYARMIVEAAKVSPELQLQMIAAVAAMQVKGVVSTGSGDDAWKRLVKNENRSDVLVQLKVMIECLKMTEDERADYCIVEQRFRKASKYYYSIAERAGLDGLDLTMPTGQECQQLIDCVVVASDEIYIRSDEMFKGRHGAARKPSHGTVVHPEFSPIVVGTALDLGKMSRKGAAHDRLLVNITAVDLKTLVRLLPPSRVKEKISRYSVRDGQVISHGEVSIDGRVIPKSLERMASMRDPEAVKHGLEYAIRKYVSPEDKARGSEIERAKITELQLALADLVELQHSTAEDLKVDEQIRDIIEDICERYEMYDGIATVSELAQMIPGVLDTADLISREKRQQLIDQAPRTIALGDYELAVSYMNNVACIEAPADVIIAMAEEEIYRAVAEQLGGRELKFRASDRGNNGKRYNDLQSAISRYDRPSRAVRRGQDVDRTSDYLQNPAANIPKRQQSQRRNRASQRSPRSRRRR